MKLKVKTLLPLFILALVFLLLCFVASRISINNRAKVIRVIDGDTVEISGGQKVRYLGINAPEIVDPARPVQCYGEEAFIKNKQLVEGKDVILEKDVSETDQYGRLLRYVWVEDTMINKLLVQEGYAQFTPFPPDVKYRQQLLDAQQQAKAEKKGLWSGVCNKTAM